MQRFWYYFPAAKVAKFQLCRNATVSKWRSELTAAHGDAGALEAAALGVVNAWCDREEEENYSDWASAVNRMPILYYQNGAGDTLVKHYSTDASVETWQASQSNWVTAGETIKSDEFDALVQGFISTPLASGVTKNFWEGAFGGYLALPAFTTTSPLDAWFQFVPVSLNIVATAAYALTYSVIAGAFPTGISMNSAGAVSGTCNSGGLFGSVTIRCAHASNPAVYKDIELSWSVQFDL